MNRWKFMSRWLLLFAVLLLLTSCQQGGGPSVKSAGKPTVVTACLPLASLAFQLAGDKIELIYAATENNYRHYQPSEQIIGEMQAADLLLLNGAGYEPWTEQVMLSPLNQTVTTMGFRQQWIELPTVTHRHGPSGEHTHAELVPYTWLDPLLLTEQLMVITRALQNLLPESRDELEQKREQMQVKLTAVNQLLQQATELLQQQPIISAQARYPYLSQRYEWNLKTLDWQVDQVPDAAAWLKFDQLHEKHPARLILWDRQPLPKVQSELAKRNIQVVLFATLEQGDPTIDIISESIENANRLLAAAKVLP